ncbi:MAG: alpha-L-rhamnosidase [Clostridia bacterium]|nr:alpha-L-rhamnosidase [Clostridia bacterium]
MTEKLIDLHSEKQTVKIIFPSRIVKAVGNVTGTENLKVPKELVVTFHESRVATLTKEDDSPCYVLLDFGKELHGGIRMVVPTATPKTVRLRLTFGESVAEALSSIDEKNATNDHSPRDFEVLASNLSTLDFGQTGFRFVKIELMEKGTIKFKNIVAINRLQDIERLGYIKTNDEMINKILDTAVYTCHLNAQNGVIWDGIKRDRLVWAGDLNSEILTFLYAFGNIPNIKNSLAILRQTSPKNVWMNNIPTYSAWWLLNLCDYYLLSGDKEFFKENIDYANYILEELDTCISTEGEMQFAKTGKPVGMEFYLDWASFQTPDAPVGTATLLLYIMKKLKKLGFEELNADRIASLEKKLDKYKDEAVEMKQTRAMQILCGGAKNGAAFMEKDGAKGFTTFMSYFLFNALYESGSKKCLDFVKEYYGGMLSRGATSFWEDFDTSWLEGSGRIDEEPKEGEKDIHGDYGAFCYKGFRHSLCHGWSSGVVAFLVEKLVGLTVLEPGYKKIRIQPDLMGLESFEAIIPTPMGVIEISANEKKIVKKIPKGIQLVD